MNLQNLTQELRCLLQADEGCYLVKADLKQAENVGVAYLSGDPGMMQVIESKGDIHTQIACLIFKKSTVTKQERQLGKKIGHASNYGMRPKRLQEICLEEEGIKVSRSEAQGLMNQYFNAFPMIKTWQRKIQIELKKSRMLMNPFGRIRTFAGFMGDDLFREAYAFLPQSLIADWVAQCIIEIGWNLDLRLQVHDELVYNVPKEYLHEEARLIRETMEQPFNINGHQVSIDVELKYGENWGNCIEYPKMPPMQKDGI